MSNDINSTILSKVNETFREITIDKKKIILSVNDILNIKDYVSDKDTNSEFMIFAEGIIIPGDIKMKEGLISVNNVVTSEDKRIIIDVSGSRGDDAEGINQDPQKTFGDKGSDGTIGGSLDLYIENEDADVMYTLLAKGGDGGNGQDGTESANGGNGGNGGDGGNVQVIIVHPYLKILSKLMRIYKNENYNKKKADLNICIEEMSQFTKLRDIKTNLKNSLGNTTTTEELNNVIRVEGNKLSILAKYWETNIVIDVTVGNGGIYGIGKKNGQSGYEGKNEGKSTILTIDTGSSLLQKKFKPFIFVHPSQCAMLLEKAKLIYFSVDPIKNLEGAHDLIILLKRLQERTAIFNNLDNKSELATYYKNNEWSIGAVNSVDTLQQIYNETTNLLNNLLNGLDYFGYDNNYVPLVSFKFYEGLLEDLITNFSMIEDEYNSYYKKLIDQKATMDTIKIAKNQQEDIIIQSNSDIKLLRQKLSDSAENISSYKFILEPKKQFVNNKMDEIKNAIQDHCDFNLESFMSALTMIAFAPQSKLMWVTQIAQLGVEEMQNVTDDKGDSVNRDFIINKLKFISTTFEGVIDEYSQLNDGSIKPDGDVNILIASEDKLFDLLDDFYDKFPKKIDDLKAAVKDYVDTIITRNNEILNYNGMIQLLRKKHQQIKYATQKLNTLDDDSFSKLDPNIPHIATFVSQMYYSARNIIMETLDLTARAYGFWSLDDNRNLMANAYGNKTLPEITTATLKQAQIVILDAYKKTVERFGNGAGIFPKKEKEKGIIFTLSKSQVEFLKKHNRIMVNISEVVSDTKKIDNPFAGACNIRISKVRVWVKGAKTSDNMLQVNIIHSGTEKIVDSDDTKFCFKHDPRYTLFKYDVTNNQIEQDGDLGWQDTETKENYSLVGPFTHWVIEIDDNWNEGLDLSEVTEVNFEFYGTNYPFKR
ncbi:hypothetical protein [Clostridium sp. JS66]|uniref:hypothetical protein n=1 Tax=Clostridium sp. JS66 TaxID=3064705 RepID=UPI00298D95A2|nr:hypothetical protein [Clostridium sp. JS66]WPC43926.1 hypothetical protein Q6H37_10745 [Clostridium sp. JS66]